MRLCVAPLLLFGSLSLGAQDGCIEGFVLDSVGAGIDTRVIGMGVDHQGSFNVGSGADGHFRIDIIPKGEYKLATSDEYHTESFEVTSLPEPADTTPATAVSGGCSSVTLRRPVRARLHLKVTDLLTAAPVLSARASFRFGPADPWAGYFDEGELLVPPLSELEIHVGATGYENSSPVSMPALNPGEVRELRVSLRPIQTGCITGIVVDDQSNPVSKVRVQTQMRDREGDNLGSHRSVVTTDAGGRFRFDKVQPGEYFLYPHPSILEYPSNVSAELVSVDVASGTGCVDVSINLGPKAGKLQLKVLDATTLKAIKYSAFASAQGPEWSSTWDLSRLPNPTPLPPFMQFEVSARVPGYREQKVTVPPLQPGEIRAVTIELQPNGDSR